jgi:hypothetical protein
MTVRPLYKPPARLGLWALEYAQVAQLVEHATENRSVGGSIPPLGTIAVSAARPAYVTCSSSAMEWFSQAVNLVCRKRDLLVCQGVRASHDQPPRSFASTAGS